MTNTNESKWRRFTIIERLNGLGLTAMNHGITYSHGQDRNYYYVVESGALDELRTQLAAAKEENARLKDEIAYLRLRDSGLTEKLRVAKEALKLAKCFIEIENLELDGSTKRSLAAPLYLADINIALAKLEDGNE